MSKSNGVGFNLNLYLLLSTLYALTWLAKLIINAFPPLCVPPSALSLIS